MLFTPAKSSPLAALPPNPLSLFLVDKLGDGWVLLPPPTFQMGTLRLWEMQVCPGGAASDLGVWLFWGLRSNGASNICCMSRQPR